MFLRRHLLRWSALLLAALFALHTFAADAPVPADNEAYNGALNHARISDRITALEVFATNHRNSPLAEDALEFALWYYLSTGGRARTMDVAAQLLRVNPENPLALAVLAHDRRSAAEANLDVERNLRETERMTNTGLKALNFMRHPQGMTDADFTAMKRQVIALLEGDAGYIALHGKRYDHAQLLLKNAVDADPESPQNVYALSLAYLNSPKPNRKDGYWYLARSVNLTQGTPAGEQIAQFAAAQYRHDGGTPQDWNQFLAATRVPAAPAATTPAAQVEVAKAEPPRNSAPTQATASRNATNTTREQPPTDRREAKKRDASDVENKKRDEQQTVARADIPKNLPPEPDNVPIDEGKRPGKSSKDDPYSSGIWKSPSADTPPAPGPIYKRPANGSPVSLGILIESAHLSKGERDALVKGITAILDDLRDSDEAFILTYGDELTFEQDLTHQPWLLQDAMSHLKSRGGDQALYDAIATSAAHLRRIAKNQNRVLLLVSDGENNAKNKRGLDLGWSVREVTVHCMGVDVSRDEDRRFLEALASRTGGHTVFVHDVQEFPAMSAQMARNIYGPPMR
jgi:hypothetical protein